MSFGDPFLHVPQVVKSRGKRFESPTFPASTYMVIPKDLLCRFFNIKRFNITGLWVDSGVASPRSFTAVRGDGSKFPAQITELEGSLGRCGNIYTHITGEDGGASDGDGYTVGFDSWWPTGGNLITSQDFDFRILDVMPVPGDDDSWALRLWIDIKFEQTFERVGWTDAKNNQWLTTLHWLPGSPPPNATVNTGSIKFKMGLLEFDVTQLVEVGGASHGVYEVSNVDTSLWTPKYKLNDLTIEVAEWWV